jgi:hypothetical protein
MMDDSGKRERVVSKGRVGRYLYWSERGVQRVAEDNGIDLEGRRSWLFGLNAHVLQTSIGSKEGRTRNRRAEAARIARKIGTAAVDDFDSPPPERFVKGVGHIEVSEFAAWNARRDQVILHTQLRSTRGRRVDLPTDDYRTGWISSAAPAIEELLRSRGTQNSTDPDEDDQSMAVDALQIALGQGSTGDDASHRGRPHTRGYTLGNSGDCEFFAEVYTDVVLDQGRWNPALRGDLLEGADRIMVGRPLWVRTMSPEAVVRYAERRSGPGWARWQLRSGRRQLRAAGGTDGATSSAPTSAFEPGPPPRQISR